MSGAAAVPGRDVVLEAAAAVEDGVAGLAAVVRARDVAVVETVLRVAAVVVVVEVLGLVESTEDAVIPRFIHWKSRHSISE